MIAMAGNWSVRFSDGMYVVSGPGFSFKDSCFDSLILCLCKEGNWNVAIFMLNCPWVPGGEKIMAIEALTNNDMLPSISFSHLPEGEVELCINRDHVNSSADSAFLQAVGWECAEVTGVIFKFNYKGSPPNL